LAAANASTHPTVNVRAQNKLPKAFVSTGVAGSGGAFAALVIAITPLNTTHGSKGVAPDPGKGLFDRRHPGRGFGYSTKPSLARDQSSPSCGLQYDSGVKSGDPAFVSQALQTLLGARLIGSGGFAMLAAIRRASSLVGSSQKESGRGPAARPDVWARWDSLSRHAVARSVAVTRSIRWVPRSPSPCRPSGARPRAWRR